MDVDARGDLLNRTSSHDGAFSQARSSSGGGIDDNGTITLNDSSSVSGDTATHSGGGFCEPPGLVQSLALGFGRGKGGSMPAPNRCCSRDLMQKIDKWVGSQGSIVGVAAETEAGGCLSNRLGEQAVRLDSAGMGVRARGGRARGRLRSSRRRSPVATMIAAALSMCVVLIPRAAAATDTTPPSVPTNLRVTSVSTSEVALGWNASTDDVRVVAYIVLRDKVRIATVDATKTAYTDTNVVANTTYTYRVRAKDAAHNRSTPSKRVTATTSSTAVVAAAGDVACSPSDKDYHDGLGTSTACRQLYTSDLLVGGGFDAVLALGDLQYESGSLSDFNASYDPSWGRVKSITHPVLGNHEYGQSGASGYFEYFGSAAGSAGKGYYSFDLASWHIVALNSNCSRVTGGCGQGSPQETWLRADLSAHPSACTIAMWHHARWSSGHDGDNTFMQAMWKDLYNADAEILLSGHSHHYERFAPQNASGGLDSTSGVRQFVVGTGGAFFTGVGSTIDANSQVHQNDTYGVLKLTLRVGAYDWRFLPEAGKTFTDSGTTSCH